FIAGQVESYNRQLHTQERELARDLAEASDGQFTLEEIEDAMRRMYHLELGEAPNHNMVIDLWDVDSVAAQYYDYDATWLTSPGEDGTARYLVQILPEGVTPEMYDYVIAQTGGEDSPYWIPPQVVREREVAEHPRAPGEDGRYPVSLEVNGGLYHMQRFECATPECVAAGAHIDHGDPETQAWNRALDAQALDDLSKAATYALMINPAGGVGLAMTLGGSGSSLVSGYLKEEAMAAGSKEAMKYGFERYLRFRGVPANEAVRISSALDIAGFWDSVIDKIYE
ncbi:hypothetical protein, partial [Vreelandella olivaria]|uniref:hypothetical protein n=1 Tax=Vreelandella olivaria TaxID=390919 RepID=UPI00201F0D92